MNDSTENDEDEIEFEAYSPQGFLLDDGQVFVYDQDEFSALTNSVACIVSNDSVKVLDRDTLKWRKIEDLRAAGQNQSAKILRFTKPADVT